MNADAGCAPRPVVKQYGEMRTGTNALRLLLATTFPTAEVLMHTLGDKHSGPVDLRQLREQLARGSRADHVVALDEATFVDRPAATTRLDDARQRRYVAEREDLLSRALVTRTLAIAISVRDPFSWICSLATMRGWMTFPSTQHFRGRPASSEIGSLVADACRAANSRYRAWLAVARTASLPTVVVMLESLVSRQQTVVDEFCALLGIPAVDSDRTIGRALPTHWDHEPTRAHRVPVTTQDLYRRRLPEAIHDVVSSEIDWELFGQLGYDKDESRNLNG